MFLRSVYIAKAENLVDKLDPENTENYCYYNLITSVPILRDLFYVSQDCLYLSAAHSKNILRKYPQWSGIGVDKTVDKYVRLDMNYTLPNTLILHTLMWSLV